MAIPVIAFATVPGDEAEMYTEGLRGLGFEVAPILTNQPNAGADIVTRVHASALVVRFSLDGPPLELLTIVRQHDPALPIIALTTSIAQSTHAAARSAGASEIDLIPVTPDALASQLVRCLARHSGAGGPAAAIEDSPRGESS